MKEARQKGVHTVFKITENENLFVVAGSILVHAWNWKGEDKGGMDYKGSIRKLLKEMKILTVLI